LGYEFELHHEKLMNEDHLFYNGLCLFIGIIGDYNMIILTNFILYDMIIIDINNTYATFCKFQVCYI
jgi:hypothetical protein